MQDKLRIRGAREHNLKNLDVDIPKNKIVVISGLSGSGKSTLAFDTIYAEGQRRYVESLSSYARQFLEMMDKPDVDSIDGLSPAIAIQQKTTSKNPRSTVGTVTEVYDYLRLLFARIGTPHCTKCHRVISSQSAEAICDTVLEEFQNDQILVLAPQISHKKGTHEKVFEAARIDGYSKVRIDGEIYSLDEDMPLLDRQKWHNIEIAVDRMTAEKSERSRLFEVIGTALKASNGTVMIHAKNGDRIFTQDNACPDCKISIGELEPRTFSFNSPFGMCKECNGVGYSEIMDPARMIPDKNKSIMQGGIRPLEDIRSYSSSFNLYLKELFKIAKVNMRAPLSKFSERQIDILMYGPAVAGTMYNDSDLIELGEYMRVGIIDMYEMTTKYRSETHRERAKQYMTRMTCETCDGGKLQRSALAVTIDGMNISQVCNISIDECHDFFANVKLTKTEQYIAKDVLKEIRNRLEFLKNVGLDYLTLNRASASLSGGESQRIRLATQIGSNLTGVLYVLDEPTIGLHQRDNTRLIQTLGRLRDIGNTIIVVEHDEEMIRSSDWLLDLGPGAGTNGGKITFEGTVEQILNNGKTVTGQYIGGMKSIQLKNKKREKKGSITVRGAAENNLKSIDVEFPLGLMTVVTGVSGSGKSSLVNEILLKALKAKLSRRGVPGKHQAIEGSKNIENVIAIDQSPIGRTPRSNPITYIDAFTPIRTLFSETQRAKERGYTVGQFSFNVDVGRCFECDGNGLKKIEMQFLSDVYVTCDRCNGMRYNSETLSVLYKGKNIAQVLDMTVEDALRFFENITSVRHKIQTLYDVGLGYIKLGQPSTTLSGGEAQRIKLASELAKRSTDRTMYILDEPTTGLHFADVQKLLDVINRLVSQGSTAVIIEHNMDVIRNADWIIDLGPEGGDEGGNLVASGTPESISRMSGSYTGKYLKKFMNR